MREDNFNNQMISAGMQTAYAPPMSLPSERADLLDKIKPSLIVDLVFHKLMGESEVNGVWVQDPALKEKALTRLGAWEISTLMVSVSSQNVALSKLKDSEIRIRTLNIIRTAQTMCLRNWKEYGIKGIDQLYFVNQIVFSNTFITLKQPQDEGIRQLLKSTTSAEIMPMPEQDRGGNGLLGGLFRRGK